MVMYPPYENHAFDGALMRCYNRCVKENAGIFSQPQGWLILAEAKLGRGDKAYRYWKEASPAAYNDRAELREMEPYVYGQFVEGKDSPFAGRAHVHWLTGTASTVMVGTVEGILGLKPEINGLVIDPSIPSEWKEFTIDKTFRGKRLHITVKNPNGSQHGVKAVTVNGKPLPENLITESVLKENNDVLVEM